MRRRFAACVVLAALPLLACGGKAHSPGSGAAESGGAGGGGTSPGPEAPQRSPIDDMDHTDGTAPAFPDGSAAFAWSGGIGNWFVTSARDLLRDATIDEIEPPRGASTKACHVSERGQPGGVDLWAQLQHPQSDPVDLRAYVGLAFWAKLESASGRLVIAVNTGPGYFAALERGDPLPAVALDASAEWREFVLSFEELGFDAGSAVSIDFVAGENGEPFELWVDDLSFLCRGACP